MAVSRWRKLKSAMGLNQNPRFKVAKKSDSNTVFVCTMLDTNFRVEVIARNVFEAEQNPAVHEACQKAFPESVRVLAQ